MMNTVIMRLLVSTVSVSADMLTPWRLGLWC